MIDEKQISIESISLEPPDLMKKTTITSALY